jgi:hypothetical protein
MEVSGGYGAYGAYGIHACGVTGSAWFRQFGQPKGFAFARNISMKHYKSEYGKFKFEVFQPFISCINYEEIHPANLFRNIKYLC